MSDAVVEGLSDIAYHADRSSLSVSGAKLLLPPSCPAKFRETQDNPPKPKPEYDFGHVAHKLVLGEGGDLAVIDAPDWRSKDAREARDKAHANGKIPILTHQLDTAERMAAKVSDHAIAAGLFASGRAEVSVYADDPVSGVRLRCRPDWITELGGRDVIVDYKTSTTADPFKWVRLAVDYGYHMAAPWYVDVTQLAGVCVDPAFVFVVQEKTPPYLVSVVELDADAVARGRVLNRRAIDVYMQCVTSGLWPGYVDDRIESVSLPPWALRDSSPGELLISVD